MQQQTQHVKSVLADPTPLGLAGLAMVTLVASSSKIGFTEGTSLVIPWAIFLGAFAQLLAGYFDFKHNNLFGAIAFSLYGFFWLGVGSSWMITHGLLGESMQASADLEQLGFGFMGYFFLSVILTVASFRTTIFLSIIMVFIDILLLGLTLDTLGFGGPWHAIAAWSELIISMLSFYGCAAALLNKMYDCTVLPVGGALIK